MASRPQTFTKVDLTPRKRHGFQVLLFILGTLVPPLAVAARFGIGTDFFINVILTICGYIPGHVHNFYIQNVRNNKNRRRTPKWVAKWGLVDTSEIKRKERRSQWASRYNDRLPSSTLRDQPYEEGQEGSSSVDLASENGDARQRTNGSGEFWSRNEEQFYGASGQGDTGSTRWRYPANFEDAAPVGGSKKSKRSKKDKKDRWARTEDAYSINEGEAPARKKKSKRKSRRANVDGDTVSRDSSTTSFPEDPEGGLYGPSRSEAEPASHGSGGNRLTEEDILNQEV
ncbi:uncharacterized protein B0H18DRAFT_893627 [Fomitopsis serialis]|uniref:uncharacterized protein n=1 Tax=Fomitopsis serialis TaxID=139415 RepID=UPI002008118E|nr:uncharacterized protein B0H18DRAFT_893627 [Neoantrodia serialis]KAH9911066.1 hypothetical protein B0H18DRAFT_893627 [Neoantrodia serialis]